MGPHNGMCTVILRQHMIARAHGFNARGRVVEQVYILAKFGRDGGQMSLSRLHFRFGCR